MSRYYVIDATCEDYEPEVLPDFRGELLGVFSKLDSARALVAQRRMAGSGVKVLVVDSLEHRRVYPPLDAGFETAGHAPATQAGPRGCATVIRAVFELQPDQRWNAYFFVAEPRPTTLGHTQGSWGHCMGELLWLREQLARWAEAEGRE